MKLLVVVSLSLTAIHAAFAQEAEERDTVVVCGRALDLLSEPAARTNAFAARSYPARSCIVLPMCFCSSLVVLESEGDEY